MCVWRAEQGKEENEGKERLCTAERIGLIRTKRNRKVGRDKRKVGATT